MSNDVKCPWNGCDGTLILEVVFKTDMGYSGLDENQQHETWRCPKCGRKVERSYKWKADKKND